MRAAFCGRAFREYCVSRLINRETPRKAAPACLSQPPRPAVFSGRLMPSYFSVGVIAGNPARFYPAFALSRMTSSLPGAALRYRLAPAELIARLRVGIRFRGIGRLFLSQLAHPLASTSTGTVSPNISYEGLLHRGLGDIAALLGRVSGAVQDQLVMNGGD